MVACSPQPALTSYRVARFNWTPAEYRTLGEIPHCTYHNYHELPLFTDVALMELLDNYPREFLQAFTMGTDPTRPADWICVDISPDSTGEDLLNAVKRGRLCLNLIKIEQFSGTYADLIDGLYDKIDRQCPHLGGIRNSGSALQISSPQTLRYYRLDVAPSMLWNMRGHERVWVYPAMDQRFAPQDYLEDIYAGNIDGEMPYETWFDQYAKCCLLEPGDVMWWPRNAPHRLEYLDLNVSIATRYATPLLQDRDRVILANRFVLRNLGIKHRSVQETGVGAEVKRLAYRAINKLHPLKAKDAPVSCYTDLQLDPGEPDGYRYLEDHVVPAFGQLKTTMM